MNGSENPFPFGEVRNKISHADAKAMEDLRLRTADSSTSLAMVIMQESIEYFIMSYEKAMEEVKGKNPKIVSISPDAVRNAANRIKNDRTPADRRPFPRRNS